MTPKADIAFLKHSVPVTSMHIPTLVFSISKVMLVKDTER